MKFRVGASMVPKEQQSGTAIGYRKNDGRTLPSLDWLHSDGEKFADRLVKILKPQLGPTSAGASQSPSLSARA